MSKIRTTEQLYDFIAGELAWRKKELQSLRALATQSSLGINRKHVLLRSIVTLTYAHWEGFIKNCSSAYLEFVAMQRLKHNELSTNFVALAIRPLLHAAQTSKKIAEHIKLVEFFHEQMESRSSIQFRDAVNTEANLSSTVLFDIVTMLGLDYSVYATKEKLLDEKLLKLRNQIAHGEYIPVDEAEIFELQDQCIELMETFQSQVDNAAVLAEYRAIK